MAASIHFIEFRTREGLMCLQRVDDISTILESTIPKKDSAPTKVIYLLLRNNNRVEVVDETRASIMDKLYQCIGTIPVIIIKQEDPQAA